MCATSRSTLPSRSTLNRRCTRDVCVKARSFFDSQRDVRGHDPSVNPHVRINFKHFENGDFLFFSGGSECASEVCHSRIERIPSEEYVF